MQWMDGREDFVLGVQPGLCAKWMLFFSEEGVSNEILDRRGLPAGGYAWNVEDDDTKNVRLEDSKWTVTQRGKLIYQEDAAAK